MLGVEEVIEAPDDMQFRRINATFMKAVIVILSERYCFNYMAILRP